MIKYLFITALVVSGGVLNVGGGALAPDPDQSEGMSLNDINLNDIPWHVGSGSWGAQVAHELPATPVTTRSVDVTTTGQFNTEAAVNGTEITITSGWSGGTTVSIDANDIDVIIPDGVTIGAIEVGVFPRETSLSRIRIRGSTLGEHSGGQMGQYRDHDLVSDVIIDGIDMNGDSGFVGGETNQAFRVDTNRLAILNTRAIAAGYIMGGDARNVTILNSNFFHGAATRTDAGYIEGWGIRNHAGPFVILHSRIEGTRYVNVRLHTEGNTEELQYISDSTFVALNEGRNLWVWESISGTNTGQGSIIENSEFYSYTKVGCFYHEINTDHSDYTQIDNNNFYSGGESNFTQAYIDGVADSNTGNTFSTLTTVPSWPYPGDPVSVPLPSGITLTAGGEAPCAYP